MPTHGRGQRQLAGLLRSRSMVGLAIAFGLVVFLAGLIFALGLIGDNKLLIGAGLLLLALCSIYGLQPDFPVRRRGE